jgi:hypothetical protein
MRELALVAILACACGGCGDARSSAAISSGASRGDLPSQQAASLQTVGADAAGEPARVAQTSDEVVVNAVPLDEPTLRQIERAYGVPVKPGRYWYDPATGVWGLEGGPSAGRIAPGLRLGGPLRADASNGDTGIFVNGRELHRLDVLAVRRCMQTAPGRYWVAQNGVGGYEGGPPLFDLNVLCRAAASRGGMQCQDGGGGQYNCGRSDTRTGVSGVIGEGGGQAGIYTDQGLVMTPN